jgi:hypothetical protein
VPQGALEEKGEARAQGNENEEQESGDFRARPALYLRLDALS